MPRGYLALIIELHHPLPGPGRSVGTDWAIAAWETYWPLLKALTMAADSGRAEVATVAVSPSWTALAADPCARAWAQAEAEQRTIDEQARSQRRFIERWESDPMEPLRRAGESGAIEVIPMAASYAWLPSVADAPVVARAQVGLAATDHTRRFGAPGAGFWLPHRAYRPGLERFIADARLRYFGVEAEAFRRGTIRPPADLFGPLVTPPGAAAFGLDTDLTARPTRDPRHAESFLADWRSRIEHAPRFGAAPPISAASVSVHDLSGAWLDRVLTLLAQPSDLIPTTPGRYLDRYPEGPVGRPGPSAGGLLSVRPAGSDLLDRCRPAADVLAEAIDHREQLSPLGQRALAGMTRSLLQAQALDWHLPPGWGLPPEEGLARAQRYLARFAELAGSLTAGRLDSARLAAFEVGPAYLPEIDLDALSG
jgi:1,4-alpha-glucan branching enzyme